MGIRMTAVPAVGAALLALAGCGGSSVGSSPLTPSAPTGSSSAATSPSSSPSLGSSPSPTVAPATGKLLNGPIATMRIPKGWQTEAGYVGYQRAFKWYPAADGDLSVDPATDPSESESTTASLNHDAKGWIRLGRTTGHRWKRLPNVELDGHPFIHLEARGDGIAELYYTVHRRHDVEIDLQWDPGDLVYTEHHRLSTAERQQLTASMLATVDLK